MSFGEFFGNGIACTFMIAVIGFLGYKIYKSIKTRKQKNKAEK